MEHHAEKPLKKHPWPLLLLGLLLAGLTGYLVYAFPPSYLLSIGSFSISLQVPFFIILFFATYSLAAYFTISSLQGVILSGAVITYLLLRYFGISHILFALLLLAIIISLEFAIYKKR